jgi:tetratricopeptide (TPR) repeat protein
MAYRHGEAISLLHLAHLHLELGDVTGARKLLDESRDALPGVDALAGDTLCALGVLSAAIGETREAVRLLERGRAHMRESGSLKDLPPCLISLGRVAIREGDRTGARSAFEEARDLAAEAGMMGPATLASVHLGALTGELGAALEDMVRHESRLEHAERIEARFLLWSATNDIAHLEEAHRLLCHLRDHAPEEYRETMIRNVPLHRDIMAAWTEHQAMAE